MSDARTIYMVAVEFKGSVTVDQEPFPDVPLPGDRGYARVPPDANGRWQVEAYRWVPGTITVHQGDDVTLEILGINGMEHPVRIQGYEVAGVVRRGQVTRLHFVADRAGIFPLVCDVHHPSMQAHLVVLAR
jgi:plastocyanin